uniref:Calpain-13 n=1 Tax=Sus scrofa TaxID=9823 RepID=A0A8D0T456_PIG
MFRGPVCNLLPWGHQRHPRGVVTNIRLHSSSSDLMMMVKTAAEAGSLMTCGTLAGPTSESTMMANGLVSRHAYTVTGAEKIQYRKSWEYLIRLWNPWGRMEWRGPWSDGSPEWQETHDPRKSQLYENKDNGEFWMSCRDFQENFSCLFVCNQVPISLDHGNTPHEKWSQVTLKNHIIPGNTAEPQRQHVFSVPDSMETNNVIVSFNIKPQNVKAKGRTFPLKFEVFKVRLPFQLFGERLPSTFFSTFRIAEKGIVSETTRNLTECFSLSPGTYVVVVSPDREAVEFLLRIFLKMPDSDRNQDSNLNLRPLKGRFLDATQLQGLLNQEFLKGSPGDTFSLDECRGIVALMDLEVNGRLNEQEFSRLWRRLVHCQSVFWNAQKNSGVFLSSDLQKAIQETDFLAGVSVTSELLDLVSLRYSDSTGRVSFPSLVCFLIRLEAMAKAFQNLSQDGKGLYLTKMEVSYLPLPETGPSPRPALLI